MFYVYGMEWESGEMDCGRKERKFSFKINDVEWIKS